MATDETQLSAIRSKYEALRPNMDERRRRLWAASEAQSLGRGGVTLVSAATGLSRGTISRGLKELVNADTLESLRSVRREGGGRKFVRDIDETLLCDLDRCRWSSENASKSII
jgi:hypothetical protein